MHTFKQNILLTLLLITISTACTRDEEYTINNGAPVVITGTIGNAPIETKANPRGDDKISYGSFSKGDEASFFASGGLKADNIKLTYDDGSFLSDNDSLQWYDGDATGIVSYYPYSATLDKIDVWRSAVPGSWNEGFDDFLIAKTNKVANGTLVGLGYGHAFAMLMIKRGYGFESGSGDIKVTLNENVSRYGKFSKTGTLTLVKEAGDKTELTANSGSYTDKNNKTTDCWYVIIPVGGYEGTDAGECTTRSITLSNNANVSVTIPYTRQYKSNWKYLVTAKMRDDRAVIETEEIRVWDNDSIKMEKPAGIGTYDEFIEWLAAYNEFRKGTGTATNGQTLSKYGTKIEGQDNWNFRLLEDIVIDRTKWGDNKSVVINTFDSKDTFDGQGHTITGIRLGSSSSSGNSGFFGILNGKVMNLRLEHISVNGTDNTGAVAGSVASGASISNCHVEGASYVLGTSNVGGIAGENNGTVDKCSSSAIVKGASKAGILVGTGTPSTNDGVSTGQVIN